MSPANDSDGLIERWLRVELGAVAEPNRAIEEAIRASATVPQRKPRRGLRAWLFPRRESPEGSSQLPEPEMVKLYEEKMQTYRQIYGALKSIQSD